VSKRCYLSGPISIAPDTYEHDFACATTVLRANGFVVVSPVEMNSDDPHYTWLDFMRDDLRLILQCDLIAVLPNWENSPGARAEVSLALSLGMPVFDTQTMQYINLSQDIKFIYG
jgi:nucleoside 2-deoxyribosyltransferase